MAEPSGLSAPIVSVPLAMVWRLAQASADATGVAGAEEAADGAADGADDGADTLGATVGAVVAAPVQADRSTAATVATLNNALRMAGSLLKD